MSHHRDYRVFGYTDLGALDDDDMFGVVFVDIDQPGPVKEVHRLVSGVPMMIDGQPEAGITVLQVVASVLALTVSYRC